MRTFLSIVWHFPFFGFMQALAFLIVGILQCLTIIFIPVGLGTMQIGIYLFNPFNKALVNKDDLVYIYPRAQRTSGFMKGFNILNRILYFFPGCFAAASMIFSTLGFFISIVGIPCGLVYARTIPSFFNPINKVCVTCEEAEKIEQAKRDLRSGGDSKSGGESKAQVSNVEQTQPLIDEVKELFVPAVKKYPSFYIFALIAIESLIFWIFISEDLYLEYFGQHIAYNVVAMAAFLLLAFHCPKRYFAPILALALIYGTYVVANIYCYNNDMSVHTYYPQMRILAIILPPFMGFVAYAKKNYLIRNSALIFIATAAFNLLWHAFIASFIIDNLFKFDAINLWYPITVFVFIATTVCEIAAYALLVMGLYKEDQQAESTNGANLGEGDKDNNLGADVLESLFD